MTLMTSIMVFATIAGALALVWMLEKLPAWTNKMFVNRCHFDSCFVITKQDAAAAYELRAQNLIGFGRKLEDGSLTFEVCNNAFDFEQMQGDKNSGKQTLYDFVVANEADEKKQATLFSNQRLPLEVLTHWRMYSVAPTLSIAFLSFVKQSRNTCVSIHTSDEKEIAPLASALQASGLPNRCFKTYIDSSTFTRMFVELQPNAPMMNAHQFEALLRSNGYSWLAIILEEKTSTATIAEAVQLFQCEWAFRARRDTDYLNKPMYHPNAISCFSTKNYFRNLIQAHAQKCLLYTVGVLTGILAFLVVVLFVFLFVSLMMQ
jgi:hypothetical protein